MISEIESRIGQSTAVLTPFFSCSTNVYSAHRTGLTGATKNTTRASHGGVFLLAERTKSPHYSNHGSETSSVAVSEYGGTSGIVSSRARRATTLGGVDV
jgi:hypothetical protein